MWELITWLDSMGSRVCLDGGAVGSSWAACAHLKGRGVYSMCQWDDVLAGNSSSMVTQNQ